MGKLNRLSKKTLLFASALILLILIGFFFHIYNNRVIYSNLLSIQSKVDDSLKSRMELIDKGKGDEFLNLWYKKFEQAATANNINVCNKLDSEFKVFDQNPLKISCNAIFSKNADICINITHKLRDIQMPQRSKCIGYVSKYTKAPINDATCNMFDYELGFYIHYKAQCLALSSNDISPCFNLMSMPPRIDGLNQTNGAETLECILNFSKIKNSYSYYQDAQKVFNQASLKAQEFETIQMESLLKEFEENKY